MAINSYDIGDQIAMAGAFTTAAGVATDPSTVTCIVRTPNGVETSYVYGTDAECTKSSTGNYLCTLTLSASGTHHYRWVGTGALIAAGELYFKVRDSAFDNP